MWFIYFPRIVVQLSSQSYVDRLSNCIMRTGLLSVGQGPCHLATHYLLYFSPPYIFDYSSACTKVCAMGCLGSKIGRLQTFDSLQPTEQFDGQAIISAPLGEQFNL